MHWDFRCHHARLTLSSVFVQILCGFFPRATRPVQMTLANTVNLVLTPAQVRRACLCRALPCRVILFAAAHDAVVHGNWRTTVVVGAERHYEFVLEGRW
jgi:hypothetical protein